MRIGLSPAILGLCTLFGVLLASGCEQQAPPDFGNVSIAEPADPPAPTDRVLNLWVRVALQAIENGHPDTAIRFAQKAVQAYPDSDEPLRVLALAYRQKEAAGIAGSAAANIANAAPAAPLTERPLAGLHAGGAAQGAAVAKPRPFGGRRSPYPLVARSGSASGGTATPVNRRPGARPAYVAYARSSKTPKSGGAAAYRIQLAAYVALDDALRGREILTRRLSDRMPPLGIFARNPQPGSDNRVNYRLRSRDLWSRSQAKMYCRAIQAAGQSCLPIRHADEVWRLVEAGTAPQTAQGGRFRPASDRYKQAGAAMPLRRTVPMAARPVPASFTPPRPALTTGGRLYRVQFAAYVDLERAILGKGILTRSLPANFPPLQILRKNGTAVNDTPANFWVRSREAWRKSRARALCAEARLAGRACFLVEANSAMWQPVVASR